MRDIFLRSYKKPRTLETDWTEQQLAYTILGATFPENHALTTFHKDSELNLSQKPHHINRRVLRH